MPPITRRTLLTTTSASLALTLLPYPLRAAADETWDLIVVGGGTAGMPTAYFASQRMRVLVIEKASILAGTLDRSTEHAGEALDWLARHGYEVLPEHPVTGSGHEHFRTPRYQWGAKGGWSIYEAMH